MSDEAVAGGYRVADRLLAGQHPEPDMRVAGLDLGEVTLFVDLTTAGERPSYMAALGGARHSRYPIADFDVPSAAAVTEILDLVDRELADGGTVYLHCGAGVGRTGTVVGCWLRRHALDDGDPLGRIASLRGDDATSPETPAQRALVTGWPEGA